MSASQAGGGRSHPPGQSGYLAPALARHEGQGPKAIIMKIAFALFLTYCFLLAINMMGAGIKYAAVNRDAKQALDDAALKTPNEELPNVAVPASTLQEAEQDLKGRLVNAPLGVTATGGYVAVGDKIIEARTKSESAVAEKRNGRIVEVDTERNVLIVEPVPEYRGWLYKIFHYAHNPFLGLLVGILVTAVFQSSSFTTSLTVGLVASIGVPEFTGTDGFGLTEAIPVIMGANIGTSVTNCLVSLGFVNRRDEFRRAFACATVHDFFNLLTVAVLFTLEQTTQLLSRMAIFIVEILFQYRDAPTEEGGGGSGGGLNPILKPVSKAIQNGVEGIFDGEQTAVGVTLTVVAGIMLFGALILLVKILRSLVLKRVESFFDRVLFRNAGIAFVVGLVITISVQSSSVTTSLVVPLAAAGLLTLNQVFPYLLGANIGTTFTAILAAFAATGHAELAMTLAMVHLLFNVIGAIIFYPLRWVPIGMARGLAARAADSRYYAVLFVMLAFFGLPLVGLGIYMLVTGSL